MTAPDGGAFAGDPDPWSHDAWVAAWGANLPLVMSGTELHGVPPAPAGMAWLVTRIVVGGRPGAEVALVRTGEGGRAVLARERVEPDGEEIATRARQMLRRLSE